MYDTHSYPIKIQVWLYGKVTLEKRVILGRLSGILISLSVINNEVTKTALLPLYTRYLALDLITENRDWDTDLFY